MSVTSKTFLEKIVIKIRFVFDIYLITFLEWLSNFLNLLVNILMVKIVQVKFHLHITEGLTNIDKDI